MKTRFLLDCAWNRTATKGAGCSVFIILQPRWHEFVFVSQPKAEKLKHKKF
jgi:hypothetical protein